MKLKPVGFIVPSLLLSTQVFAGATSQDFVSNFSDKIDQAIAQINESEVKGICSGIDNVLNRPYDQAEMAKSKGQKFWNRTLKEINESSTNLLSTGISSNRDKYSLGLDIDISSQFLYQKKHIGVDRFTLNLGLSFPHAMREGAAGLGLNDKREVVFSRLYPSLCQSLVRIPYNPLTRMPLTAEKARLLEVGELVSFTTPLTVSVGAGRSEASGSVYRSSDVQVNIFKMNEKEVRVRMVARADGGIAFRAGVIEKLGLVRVLQASQDVSFGSADLALLDYVFDLSDAQAAEVYTKFMSFNDVVEFDLSKINQRIKAAIKGSEKAIKSIVIDELNLMEAAQKTPGIKKLMVTDARIENSNFNFNFNFLNLVRLNQNVQYADTTIDKNSNVPSFMRSISQNETSKFFKLNSQNSFMLASMITDKDKKPTGFMMLKQKVRSDVQSVTMDKWEAYLKELPMTKTKANKMSDLRPQLEAIRKSGKVRSQELYFLDSAQFLQNLDGSLTHDKIKKHIQDLFQIAAEKNAPFTSKPIGVDYSSDSNNRFVEEFNSMMSDLSRWNKLTPKQKVDKWNFMYSYEIGVIADNIMNLANAKKEINERLLGFNALIQTPLFNEMAMALTSRMIPENHIDDVIVYDVNIQSLDNENLKPIVFHSGKDSLQSYVDNSRTMEARNFAMQPGSDYHIYVDVFGNPKKTSELIKH